MEYVMQFWCQIDQRNCFVAIHFQRVHESFMNFKLIVARGWEMMQLFTYFAEKQPQRSMGVIFWLI